MGGNSSPSPPATTRLPTQTDPALRAAQQRAQQAAQNRTGRSSTILSDALRSVVGSAGKLGS